MIYTDLSEREELLAKEIVDAAYKVHRELGPGLLERIYETCFCFELEQKGIPYKRQERLTINYKHTLFFEEELRVDVFVDDRVICELKSVLELHPVWMKQINSYLKLTDLRLGFLINFNVSLIRDGIKRFKR